mmetsp:Transcript_88534/g.147075  ORF Transcript_88534/g.147075 Transcript_88534/m.147075 type:complete len:89 (+) Transcript_88534:1059-1325(+)
MGSCIFTCPTVTHVYPRVLAIFFSETCRSPSLRSSLRCIVQALFKYSISPPPGCHPGAYRPPKDLNGAHQGVFGYTLKRALQNSTGKI